MKKIILGLDVASYKTGWCLLEYDTDTKAYTYYQSGIFEIDKNTDEKSNILGYRINFVRSSVKWLIDTYDVDHIAIEEVYNGHASASAVLHRVHGSLIEMLYNAGMAYEYYPNTTVKKVIVKGNAEKYEIAEKVQGMLNITLKFKKGKDETYDETDAIGVAITYVKDKFLQEVERKKKPKKKSKKV
jgi:crossover junction endodeoxyribonuclease RuvC